MIRIDIKDPRGGMKYHELDADKVFVHHSFILKKERLELMEEFFRITNQGFSRFLS